MRVIFERPAHPYTRALIRAIQTSDPRHRTEVVPLKGEVPSPVDPPPGCAFHPRCPFAKEACREVVPRLEPLGNAAGQATLSTRHRAACTRTGEI